MFIALLPPDNTELKGSSSTISSILFKEFEVLLLICCVALPLAIFQPYCGVKI